MEHSLTDCVVFLGTGLEPWCCARVETSDGRFSRIDPIAPWKPGDRVTQLLVPGLVNAHTHMGDSVAPDGATGLTLEQGFFRPEGFKYRMLREQPAEAHIEHIAAHLAYMRATGTVRHIDFREQGLEGSRRLREAARRTGVDAVILGQFDQVPFSEGELEANLASLPASARKELSALLGVADGFSESTMNDLTDAAWTEIREATKAVGKLRAIHCLENVGYRELSLERTGRGDLIRAIELYDPHLVIHLTVANDAEIALLAEHDVLCVLNPRANANLGLPLPPIAKLIEAGVKCLLGTDNGLLNSPNMLAELDFTYKVAKAQFGDALRPDPEAILAMATSNLRHLKGFESHGRIEEGAPAEAFVVNWDQGHLRASHHLLASLITRVTPADVVETWV